MRVLQFVLYFTHISCIWLGVVRLKPRARLQLHASLGRADREGWSRKGGRTGEGYGGRGGLGGEAEGGGGSAGTLAQLAGSGKYRLTAAE